MTTRARMAALLVALRDEGPISSEAIARRLHISRRSVRAKTRRMRRNVGLEE